MAFVYVLVTRDGTRYIGSTVNIDRRFREHTNGRVLSTKHKRPVRLFAVRTCSTISEAVLWEKKYKRSHGQLERDIRKGIVHVVAHPLAPAGQSPLGGARP